MWYLVLVQQPAQQLGVRPRGVQRHVLALVRRGLPVHGGGVHRARGGGGEAGRRLAARPGGVHQGGVVVLRMLRDSVVLS